jgi:hypothetical protein
MLRFEREVVTALGSAPDQPTRSAVEGFVDGSLRAMPELIRLGVLGESFLFTAYAKLLAVVGRPLDDPEALRRQLDAWEGSRIGVVRQYVHMFRSLVVFAENEKAPQGAGGAGEGAA